MKKTFFLLSLTLLLNGCFQSVALLSGSAVGASSGKLVQSSLKSTISYGIKKQTGKTPLGHVLAYAEKNNPERKKETCISFIEKTRSEFCTIAKNRISLTNKVIKEKIVSSITLNSKITDPYSAEIAMKPKNKENEKTPIKREVKINIKNLNYFNNLNQSNKSPRELAIAFQNKLKLKENYIK